jgi:hypothetical protein
MARAVAAGPTQAASGIQRAQATPTSAENMLPATTGQGWASGLAGSAKTSTALAPSGATSHWPLPGSAN